MSVMRVATFIISVFIVGMVEMMVAGIMNLMSGDPVSLKRLLVSL